QARTIRRRRREIVGLYENLLRRQVAEQNRAVVIVTVVVIQNQRARAIGQLIFLLHRNEGSLLGTLGKVVRAQRTRRFPGSLVVGLVHIASDDGGSLGDISADAARMIPMVVRVDQI